MTPNQSTADFFSCPQQSVKESDPRHAGGLPLKLAIFQIIMEPLRAYLPFRGVNDTNLLLQKSNKTRLGTPLPLLESFQE